MNRKQITGREAGNIADGIARATHMQMDAYRFNTDRTVSREVSDAFGNARSFLSIALEFAVDGFCEPERLALLKDWLLNDRLRTEFDMRQWAAEHAGKVA